MKNKIFGLLFFIFLGAGAYITHAQIITTIVGDGTSGLGDGGPAVDCQLNNPYSVAIDGIGNFYIADRNNSRIRKVDESGVITTIAGTGTPSYSGDGGQATAAEINYPFGVAVDGSGNVFFTDRGNNCVRKISTSGIITTVAGNDTVGFRGDGGAATMAEMNAPCGIVVDERGNIFVCDGYNSCVRKINATGIISTIAGVGGGAPGYSGDGGPAVAAQLNQPYGIALDARGNLFITEWSNHIRKIGTSGIISTIAGTGTTGYSGDGGPANLAEFDRPVGVAVDGGENVYIADAYNSRIRKINASGIITTIAGTGTVGFSGDGTLAVTAELSAPSGIALDGNGNLYIADLGNDRIRYIKNTTGLNTVSSIDENLNIFPNPNNGIFTVNITSSINNLVQIIISNELGEKIKSITANTNQVLPIKIDVTPGIYILTATTSTATRTKKIFITQ